MSGFAHTPGPWAFETPMGDEFPWIVQDGLQAHEWEPIATVGNGDEDLPPQGKQQRTVTANAARIVSAVNAADRAGLTNAALDAGVIGQLVEALEGLTQQYGDYSHMSDRDIALEAKAYPGSRIEGEMAARAALALARGDAS